MQFKAGSLSTILGYCNGDGRSRLIYYPFTLELSYMSFTKQLAAVLCCVVDQKLSTNRAWLLIGNAMIGSSIIISD